MKIFVKKYIKSMKNSWFCKKCTNKNYGGKNKYETAKVWWYNHFYPKEKKGKKSDEIEGKLYDRLKEIAEKELEEMREKYNI